MPSLKMARTGHFHVDAPLRLSDETAQQSVIVQPPEKGRKKTFPRLWIPEARGQN